METFLITLVICSISMSFLCLAAYLVGRTRGRRYQPQSLYLVWLVILLGFAIPWRPILWQVQKPQPLLRLETANLQTETPRSKSMSVHQPVNPENPPQVAPKTVDASNYPLVEEGRASVSQSVLPNSPIQMLGILWSVGALSVAGFAIFRHVRLLQAIRRWGSPVTEGIAYEEMQFVARQLGYHRPVVLVVAPIVDSPMTLGFIKPRILLPDNHFSIRELQVVFRHEIVHLKRGDLYAKALALLATALHWFNPLIWLAAKQANIYCEASCDAVVMLGSNFSERQNYSQIIVSSLRDRGGRAATCLGTGFRGGKEEMKHRISMIMDLKQKRFASLLLVMMLLFSSIGGIALTTPASQVMETLLSDPNETNYRGLPVNRVEFAARKAVIADPNNPYGGLCLISDDYEIPAAAYINGTSITVTQRERSRGGFPASINDPEEQWVLAEVVVPDGSHKVSGWIPQGAIRYLENENQSEEAPDYPKGRLKDPSGEIALYFDNGLTDRVMTTLPEGTEAIVIGYMYRFFHVLAGDQAGFIGLDQIEFTGEDLALYEKTRVKDMGGFPGLSDIMAGHAERYEEYARKREVIMGIMDWETANPSLSTRAKLSALALEYGYDYMSTVNVMPGEDDLKEEEVATLGKEQLMEKYGLLDSDIQGRELLFYYKADKPEERFWRVILHVRPGLGNVSVVLDSEGNLIETFQAKGYPYTPDPAPDEETLKALQEDISYYQEYIYADYPGEEDLTREQAIEKGWDVVATKLNMDETQMKLAQIAFFNRQEHGKRWWMLAFMGKDDFWSYPQFYVALVSPGGEKVITSDPNQYRADRSYMEEQKLCISYYTEDVGFATPGKEDFTREEAVKMAWQVFEEKMPGMDREMMELKQASFYNKFLDERTWWLVRLEYRKKIETLPDDYYEVAIISPRGKEIFVTSSESFENYVKSIEKGIQKKELEQVRGPFHTWTLEQQAAFYPEAYALPPEGAISREKAIEIAVKTIMEQFGQSQEQMDQRIITSYFTIENFWLVEFHTEQTLKNPDTGYFQVFIQPMDGEIYQVNDDQGHG